MADISTREVTPVYLKLLAFLNGLATIDSVLRVAWPDAIFEGFQRDIVASILGGLNGTYREVGIKGCTGAGKGASVAAAANLWFEASDGAKIVINSQSRPHALEVMFSEIVRWRKAMRCRCSDEILETRIKVHEQKHIVVTNPDKGEGLTGHHGGAILFIFDEATATPEQFWELAKTQADMLVALGNPRTRGGWFKSLFPEIDPDKTQDVITEGGSRRRVITIGGMDCTNVRMQKVVIPNQLTWESYREIKSNPDPNHGRVYADGQFPVEDTELQLILPSWIPRHTEARRHATPEIEAFGLDVADSTGGDETILACGGRDGMNCFLTRRKSNTMKTVGWVLSRCREKLKIDLTRRQHPIVVDADGLGKGVADRLEEIGCWVIKHRGSESADDKRAYYNRRTETYARLAIRLNPEGPFGVDPWAIPHDTKLIEELVAPDKIYESDGLRFRITPKNAPSGARVQRDHRGQVITTLHQRLRRSPDRADAVAMLWAGVYALHYSDSEPFVVRDDELVIPVAGDEELEPDEIDGFDLYFKELLSDDDQEPGAGDFRGTQGRLGYTGRPRIPRL